MPNIQNSSTQPMQGPILDRVKACGKDAKFDWQYKTARGIEFSQQEMLDFLSGMAPEYRQQVTIQSLHLVSESWWD